MTSVALQYMPNKLQRPLSLTIIKAGPRGYTAILGCAVRARKL